MRFLILTGLLLITFISCKDEDDSISFRKYDFEIEDFIWEGLNTYYYWQAIVPDLADDRFSSQKSYAAFLSQSSENQEMLFKSLLLDKDRFSWIVSDYTVLEKQLSRIYKTNGMMIGLATIRNSDDLIAYVRYVLPGSDAAAKNIKRGDVFVSVNNEQLTINNYNELLNSEEESYSIQLAEINEGTVTPTSKSIDLVKAEIQENPIHKQRVIELNNKKIGYLMYNGFVADFDAELESVLAGFQTQGVSDFIIDLRYNRGGQTSSSIKLASMITGQFSGELFAQIKHNEKLSSLNESQQFESNPVKLGMTKLFVISSSSTASSSELLINGLSPYIDVILVGDHTTGKNVGSYTIYDWIDSNRTVNPRHNWAMQPITTKISNADGFADFEDGIQADHILRENIANLGTLGEIDEPLLEKTLEILGALPARLEKKAIDINNIHFKQFVPLQKALMHFDTPTKIHTIRQSKDFYLE